MKIKFNSDDLPLYKIPKLHDMMIVVRAVFHEDNKSYPLVSRMNVCINYEY